TVGEPELAAEVPGRHVHATGEGLDVKRQRELPVDPVADTPQPGEVGQMLLLVPSAGHRPDDATSRRRRSPPRRWARLGWPGPESSATTPRRPAMAMRGASPRPWTSSGLRRLCSAIP